MTPKMRFGAESSVASVEEAGCCAKTTPVEETRIRQMKRFSMTLGSMTTYLKSTARGRPNINRGHVVEDSMPAKLQK
jgi:hypothetical protein